MKRILIVDDESAVRAVLREFLETNGFEVSEAASCAAAEKAAQGGFPDAVVLDYRLPDGDAFELLPRLKGPDPDLPVVILTGYPSAELAARGIHGGADHFLAKPMELPALRVLLGRLLENRRARQRQAAQRTRRAADPQPFLGASEAIRTLESQARAALGSTGPILIHGEPGSGKGVLADWLHRSGPRAPEAFVEVHCAGLSRESLEARLFGRERGALAGAAASEPGVLDLAHHGTVFLDEIDEMDLAVQAKLLELIEGKRFRRLGDTRDRTVDVALVAAARQDLRALAGRRKFREDLLDRMGAVSLRVPPLRERPQDVPALARAILRDLAIELGRPEAILTPDAEAALTTLPWPGNVRELRNALERAFLASGGGPIGLAHVLPEPPARDAAAGGDLDRFTLAEVERRHIERALELEGGHVERAAKRLGVPRSTLYQRVKQLGLSSRR